jgi:hypothetical protein
MRYLLLAFIVFAILLVSGCSPQLVDPATLPSRESKIPSDAVKMTPATDDHPPILHSDEFEQPVPFDAVNSAGAEDSPFIPVGKDEFYFFFTPDVRVSVEKQVIDGVTGIYMIKKQGNGWSKPERVMLQEKGKLSLDGCEFVQGNTIWFCAAREGYTGLHWFTAEFKDGVWKDWKQADFKPEYEVGELHISADGGELYFHSGRAGGKTGLDIWSSKKVDGEWSAPVNIGVVNSPDNEGWPYLSSDGKELWFTRFYKGTPALFRSKLVDGEWQQPELIVETFAGEPTLDNAGNLYFVHHYYNNGTMIEADIYVAKHK